MSLYEELMALEKVQLVDASLDLCKKEHTFEPGALTQIRQAFQEREALCQQLDQKMEGVKVARTQAESAHVLNEERLQRALVKMEAVKKPAEYQAMTREVEQIKKLSSSLLDERLRQDEAHDLLQAEHAQQFAQLGQLRSDFEKETQHFTAVQSELSSRMAQLQQERQQHAESIQKSLLKQYERIRIARKGIGLVVASLGRCAGCHMMVPPQLYNQLQKGQEIVTCPSCLRLLRPEKSAGL